MDAQVDSLQIEIESSSTTAEQGINDLASALNTLKNAASSGAGLGNVSKQLKALNNATRAAKPDYSALTDEISKVARAYSSLPSSVQKSATAFARAKASMDALSGTKTVATLNEAKGALDSFSKSVSSASSTISSQAVITESVGKAYAALPPQIQKAITANAKLTASNNTTSKSYVTLNSVLNSFTTKVGVAIFAARRIGSVIGSWISAASSYIETINLFTVTMGEYADAELEYIDKVSKKMGINPVEWMSDQGIFMTLIKGFGVSADRAALMSRNLTALGYDLASLYEDKIPSTTEAMQKLQSGIAGELEPLRAVGFDLSQAKLEAVAMSLGIDQSVASMTQAQKAQLRYYAILTQVTWAQEDFARTLNSPANQLRVFRASVEQASQALGTIFIPVLNAVLPYAIAFFNIIRQIAEAIARLFHFELPEVDYSGLSSGVVDVENAVSDMEDSFGGATSAAKELKATILGFDQLNVMNAPTTSSGSGGGGGTVSGGGGDFDFPLPDYSDSFLANAIESNAKEIEQKLLPVLREVAKVVGAIAVGFAAWKVSQGIQRVLDTLSNFKGFSGGIGSLGIISLFSDLTWLMKYADDFVANGATFENVVGMISEFTGMVGSVSVVTGNFKTAGILDFIQGVGEISVAIKDISANGVDWDNATTAIRGLGNVVSAIGYLKQDVKAIGTGFAIQGLATIINEISANWEAIKNGDWSGVDKATLAAAAIQALGGVFTALGWLSKITSAIGIGSSSSQALDNAANTTQTVKDSLNTKLSPNLTSLAKNLGMGVVIIGEVSAAAVLVTGAIALLGYELEQVANSWQPVIDNGGTVVTAIGLGAALLGAIGLAAYGLGTLGTSAVVNLGIGAAVLVEIGAASALFIAEVWAIGWGLEQVGQSWQPVIDNGSTVATAIGLGTALLVGVGLASYALGTVGGAIALNVGIGTAILLELGAATALFIAEIWAIGWGLDQVGQAWQPVLDNGETIAEGIGLGTALLVGIGVVTAALGAATVATAGLLPAAIGLGTAILVELSAALILFTESLVAVADELNYNLAPSLSSLNTKLPDLTDDMSDFVDFISAFANEAAEYTKSSAVAGFSATVDAIVDFFTKDPYGALTDEVQHVYEETQSLNEKLNLANPELESAVALTSDFTSLVNELDALVGDEKSVNFSKGLKVNMKEAGAGVITGLADGMKSEINTLKPYGEKIIQTIQGGIDDATNNLGFNTQAQNVMNGITAGFSSATINSYQIETGVNKLANAINTAAGKNPATVTKPIGKNMMAGIEAGMIEYEYKTSTYATIINDMVSQLNSALNNGAVSSSIKSLGNKINSIIASGISGNSGSVSSAFTSMLNTMLSRFEIFISRIRSALNTTLSNFSRSMSSVKVSAAGRVTYSNMSPVYITRFATGGFPDIGQLFLAREAGPELVGTMGGRTAVANNEQIEQGIYRATYDANSEQNALLREQNDLLRRLLDKDTTAVISTSDIVNGLSRKNRRDGKTVVPVGNNSLAPVSHG